MAKPNKITVLGEFRPYYHVLEAYNAEKFNANRPQAIKNIGFALGLAIFIAFIPNAILLALWKLIDEDCALAEAIAVLPILFTILQYLITIVVLVWENRPIDETIARLQSAIDQRK